MSAAERPRDGSLGAWVAGEVPATFGSEGVRMATGEVRSPAHLLQDPATGVLGVGLGGLLNAPPTTASPSYPCLGVLPPLYPEWLGDRGFCEAHGVRFAYVAGAMARGIHSVAMTVAMGRSGMLGFLGAAGLGLDATERALAEIDAALGERPWGCNLIHSPNEPELEAATAELLLQRNVRRVSASAYMSLTLPVVRYAFSGVRRTPQGEIVRERHVFAKISRPETAQHFMSPPPHELLDELCRRGQLTPDEVALAKRLPVAEDITVEADSGGHTDNQTLTALFPTIASLRDRLALHHGHGRTVRVGAAGGLGTPSALAAAFSLGAAYVLTGSVNQSALEAGISAETKQMLAQARLGDVAMCPCADMFEMGVQVQVLKRGTLFAQRARQLYDLYTRLPSLDAIPDATRAALEKNVFRQPLATVWEHTRAFFLERNPAEVARAEADRKHQMALVFRWYLGSSSHWPIQAVSERRTDYQVWCGPAMGAFNAWVEGSFLEPCERRSVVQIARNLLEGAATVTRAQQLRSYGVAVPPAAFDFRPRPLS